MLTRLVLAALVFAGFSACKTTSESTVRSLGGMAGDKSLFTCSASGGSKFSERYETFWAHGGVSAPAGYQESLKSIFAAVPIELQSWFFLKGGNIKLIGNPKEACSSRESTPLLYSNGEQGGCVMFPVENNLAGMPTIFVGITTDTKAQQLEQASLIVSGFAAVLGSFLTEIASTDNLSSSNDLLYEFGAYDKEMRNVKAGLAFMVLEDLIKNKNADGRSFAETLPSNYKSMLSSSKVLDTSIDRDSRWKAFWAAYNDAGHREMTNFLVAQVFESAWCSDTTRAALFSENALFAETGRYFKKEVEPVFSQAFAGNPSGGLGLAEGSNASGEESSSESMSTAPNGRVSLSLGEGRMFPILGAVVSAPFAVGRYFAQNRPVRNWFATYQPVRRVTFGTLHAVGSIGRGVAVFSGRAVNGVARVVGNGLGRIGYGLQNGCLIRRWRC